jgi:hypothetical protein
MVAVIITDNFLMGMGASAIVAFMMSVCSRKFTGTQYALLSSLTAFTRVILIAPAGTLVKAMGWTNFYVMSVFLAIPGLLLLSRFDGWTSGSENEKRQPISMLDMFVIGIFLLSLILVSTDFIWPMLKLPAIGLRAGATGLVISIGTWILKPKKA